MPDTPHDSPISDAAEPSPAPGIEVDADELRIEAELLRARDEPQSRNFELVSALASLRHPALVLDEAGTVAFSNRAAVRLFGSAGPRELASLVSLDAAGGAIALVDLAGGTRELAARVMPVRWGEGRGRILLLRPSASPRPRPSVDEATARSAAVGRLRAAQAAIESGLDRLREHGGTPAVDHAVVALRAMLQQLEHTCVALDAIEADPGVGD